MKNHTKHLCFSLLFIFVVSFAVAEQTTTAAVQDFGNLGADILDTELLTVTPTELNFGNVELGSVAYAQVELLSSVDLTITSMTIPGSTDYTITSMLFPPFDLMPDVPQVLEIAFAPSIADEITGNLEIMYGIGNMKQVPLEGFGFDPPPMLDLPYYYDFGDITIGGQGDVADISITLSSEWLAYHSTGEITSISISGDPCFVLGAITDATTYAAVTLPTELGPSGMLNVSISCNPTSEGGVYGMLDVLCGDGRTYSVNLYATGMLPEPLIEISPDYVILNAVEGSSDTGMFYVKTLVLGCWNFGWMKACLPGLALARWLAM